MWSCVCVLLLMRRNKRYRIIPRIGYTHTHTHGRVYNNIVQTPWWWRRRRRVMARREGEGGREGERERESEVTAVAMVVVLAATSRTRASTTCARRRRIRTSKSLWRRRRRRRRTESVYNTCTWAGAATRARRPPILHERNATVERNGIGGGRRTRGTGVGERMRDRYRFAGITSLANACHPATTPMAEADVAPPYE